MFYVNSTAHQTVGGGGKHYHSAMEFYLLTEGRCNYLIDDELYEIKTGDLVCIPQGMIHKTSYSGRHSRMLVNCSGEFIGNVLLPSYRVFRNEELFLRIKGLFEMMEQEYLQNDAFSETMLEGYMRELLVLLCRHKNRYINERQANQTIRQILEYLHEHYTSNVTLTSLSVQYGISPEHISRTFKKEAGLNFNEYLSQLRLKKAEMMLKFGNESVAEVAFACGFNDSNYFSEKFKTVYKLSPLKFRQKKRAISQKE